MKSIGVRTALILSLSALALCSCATHTSMSRDDTTMADAREQLPADYSERLPQRIQTGERTVLVDPKVHAWGAYDSDGYLIRAGLATAGGSWCPDIGRPCYTKAGTFRIFTMGGEGCKSSIYPLPRGGAPMPYCMFFNRGQGLHGSYEVVEGNVSHGCVRMQVMDAEWLRNNFASVGTKVVVKPYH